MDHNESFPWLPTTGFVFLTFNSALAIYRSKADAGSITFVLATYLDLLLLFWCMHLYERRGSQFGGGGRRGGGTLKAAIWALITLLVAMFSIKIGELFPQPISGMACGMGVALSLQLFYDLFILGVPTSSIPNPREDLANSTLLRARPSPSPRLERMAGPGGDGVPHELTGGLSAEVA